MNNRLKISKFWQESEPAHPEQSETANELGTHLKLVPRRLPHLRLERILVPFDFSDSSALILRRLVPLAERSGAALHLVNIVPPELPRKGLENREFWVSEDRTAEAAQNIVDLWRDRIVRGRAKTYTSIRIGRRVEEILSKAKALEADLIVMTSRGYAGSNHPFMRSTAEQVSRHAPCPVLTIPESKLHDFGPDYDGFPPSVWKKILMPVDFSRCASKALKYAAAVAIENRAKLILLNAILDAEGSVGIPATNGAQQPAHFERDAERRLRVWVERELGIPLEFESSIWFGIASMYAVLLEARRSNADLIVMPTRNASRTKRFRVGSVKDAILRNTTCPVLSIHEDMHEYQ